MICNVCGANNENNAKICILCGNNLMPQNNDEPFIPRLDTERVNMPQAGSMPIPAQQFFGQQNANNPQQQYPPPLGMPPPMYNQYGQPPIMGYDVNGMPVYPPPMYNQYGQPPIMGYDANGMPIYPPPMYNQYGQPPVMTYDANGMPIYPPPMYNQYGQPQQMGYPPPPPPPQQNMQTIQDIPIIPDIPELTPVEPKKEEKKEEKVDISDDFWAFFDGGKSSKNRVEQSEEDFFGKSSKIDSMNDVSALGLDIDALKKKNNRQKNSYMNDTPIVDAEKIEKYDPSKLNQMYMQNAEASNSNDLMGSSNGQKKSSNKERMVSARQVDVKKLSVKVKTKSKISMGETETVNANSLEAYVPEHKESMMAQAERAVNALPKKINPYQSELDDIEIPEYMKAKKTKKEEVIEIPSLPDLNKN